MYYSGLSAREHLPNPYADPIIYHSFHHISSTQAIHPCLSTHIVYTRGSAEVCPKGECFLHDSFVEFSLRPVVAI